MLSTLWLWNGREGSARELVGKVAGNLLGREIEGRYGFEAEKGGKCSVRC